MRGIQDINSSRKEPNEYPPAMDAIKYNQCIKYNLWWCTVKFSKIFKSLQYSVIMQMWLLKDIYLLGGLVDSCGFDKIKKH